MLMAFRGKKLFNVNNGNLKRDSGASDQFQLSWMPAKLPKSLKVFMRQFKFQDYEAPLSEYMCTQSGGVRV